MKITLVIKILRIIKILQHPFPSRGKFLNRNFLNYRNSFGGKTRVFQKQDKINENFKMIHDLHIPF